MFEKATLESTDEATKMVRFQSRVEKEGKNTSKN
jgi:hypothetical protein